MDQIDHTTLDQLGFLVALPSPLDKQQKGVLRRCIAGVGLHTRVCTRYPATSAAVHCAQQRTRTCSLSVHLHLKRAAGQQAVMMPLTSTRRRANVRMRLCLPGLQSAAGSNAQLKASSDMRF